MMPPWKQDKSASIGAEDPNGNGGALFHVVTGESEMNHSSGKEDYDTLGANGYTTSAALTTFNASTEFMPTPPVMASSIGERSPVRFAGSAGRSSDPNDTDIVAQDSTDGTESATSAAHKPASVDLNTSLGQGRQRNGADYGRTLWEAAMSIFSRSPSERSHSKKDTLESEEMHASKESSEALPANPNDVTSGENFGGIASRGTDAMHPFESGRDHAFTDYLDGRPTIQESIPDRSSGSTVGDVQPAEASEERDVNFQPATTQMDFTTREFPKKLRRFRRMTDQILLKRTVWRNQYAELERLREHYNESVMRVIISMQIPRSTSDYPYTRRQERKWKRKTARASIAKANAMLEELLPSEPITPSTSEPDASVQSVVESRATGSSDSVPNLALAQEELLKNHKLLNIQETKVKELMDELNNLEFHISNLERELSNQMHSERFAGQLRLDLEDDLSISNSEVTVDSESDDPPPLVAEYFDAAGNYNIYLERMEDLDYEYQEGLVFREVLRDRDEPLEPSDEAYSSNYLSHRRDIENSLNQTRDLMRDLQIRCEQAGLDPELYRNAAVSMNSVSGSRSAHVNLALSGRMQQASLVPSERMSPSKPGQRYVQSWVDEVMLNSRPDDDDSAPLMVPSLASFEQQGFDLEAFGLPKKLEVG